MMMKTLTAFVLIAANAAFGAPQAGSLADPENARNVRADWVETPVQKSNLADLGSMATIDAQSLVARQSHPSIVERSKSKAYSLPTGRLFAGSIGQASAALSKGEPSSKFAVDASAFDGVAATRIGSRGKMSDLSGDRFAAPALQSRHKLGAEPFTKPGAE